MLEFRLEPSIFLWLLAWRSAPMVESAIWVNWGTVSFRKLRPSIVVDLLKDNNIPKVKLFEAEADVLTALKGSGIKDMLGIPNEMLSMLSSSPSAADLWVRQNVSSYMGKGGVSIWYIAVGNEPFLTSYNGQFQNLVMPTVLNLQQSLVKANIAGSVKLVVRPEENIYNLHCPVIEFLTHLGHNSPAQLY